MRKLHYFHEHSCVSLSRPHLPCDLTEYCDRWDVLDIYSLHWWNSLRQETCSPISLPHFGRDFTLHEDRQLLILLVIYNVMQVLRLYHIQSDIPQHISTPLLTTFLTSIRSFCPFISLPTPSRLRIHEKEGIQYNKQNKRKTREENTLK